MQALSKDSAVNELVEGSVITPKGFMADGIHAGLRYQKKDLGVILSEVPASCAAVYTVNQFQAAPLKVTQDSIFKEEKLQAIIVNSACANACTGERGLSDAFEMRKWTAEKFNLSEHYVGVASTGVIGEFLPMEKIYVGIQSLDPKANKQQIEAFQTSILTTDTVMKNCCYAAEIDGQIVNMGGAAKGSGMINPNMATMLAFITTDAAIESEYLQVALKEVTETTFNQITVDGDTSTNDTVVVLANGKSGNQPLSPHHPQWEIFIELLTKSCESLAKQIAKDGEGATKLIEVEVSGAMNNLDARMAAKQIVGSNLVKTAIHGEDANWGRIISAIGQSNAIINPSSVDIAIGPIPMLKKSEPQLFSEEEASQYLKSKMIHIFVDLHLGDGKAKAWGCDLSYDYVKINANYRS